MLVTTKHHRVRLGVLSTLLYHCTAHNVQAPHSHPVQQPSQELHSHGAGLTQHSHNGGIKGHGHAQAAPAAHSHRPGQNTHPHGPNSDHRHTMAGPVLRRTLYTISNLWNGSLDTVSQAPAQVPAQNVRRANDVKLTLEDRPGSNAIVIYIDAPFYDDPKPPNGIRGKPYFKLWEYEVVEAFFLSSNSKQYVELEFGPHGQHLVLLLNGRRNAIKHSLPLNYRSQIKNHRWFGKAIIPLDYFPPNVDHFNAYSIHDQHISPIYKALYPSDGPQPDFHHLESFNEFSALPSLSHIKQLSSTWTDAIKNPWKPENK